MAKQSVSRKHRSNRSAALYVPGPGFRLHSEYQQYGEVRTYVRAFNRLNHLRDTAFESQTVEEIEIKTPEEYAA